MNSDATENRQPFQPGAFTCDSMNTPKNTCRSVIALFVLQGLWMAASYAQSPVNVPFRDEISRQESIYQSTGDKVPTGYSIDRSLEDYTRGLTSEFDRALASLGPKDRWLDIGAGKGHAILDYYTPGYDLTRPGGFIQRGKAQAVAISIEDRRSTRWQQEAPGHGANSTQYLFSKRLQEYSLQELGRFQVITDVIGGFSYSPNLSEFMEKTLGFLELNGSFFTLLQDVRSEGGTNQPFYAGARFLTEIAKADGSEMKVCTWLKSITCVEVSCEFTTSWRPPIESYRVRKLCDNVTVPVLTPLLYEAGTPPERRYQISIPSPAPANPTR